VYQKIYCASKKIVVYQEISLCSEKDCGVLEKIVVFSKRLLCSPKDRCVLQKIVVFSKRLLCSPKDCCVSEERLSCVLPLLATVVMPRCSGEEVVFLDELFGIFWFV